MALNTPTVTANISDAVRVIGLSFRKIASGAAKCTTIRTRP